MSPKILSGRHAELVGGHVVEPGQPIPDDAEPEALKALQARGVVRDAAKPKPKSTKAQEG